MEKLNNLIFINNNSQNIVSLKSELVKIIKESLSDQDKSFETYKLERSNLDNLTVAKKSAGENDIFTFKQQSIIKESSEKILYFIKNASYSDDEKVQGMVKEMTREFRRLDIRSLAGLEIVRGTYQKIIDELYVEGRLDERLNLNINIFAQSMNMYRMVQDTLKPKQKRIKQMIAFTIVILFIVFVIIAFM